MSDDRKTLEQRAQMTDIERLRHSAAHVLATAILKIWPEAQFAAGPPVENGEHYSGTCRVRYWRIVLALGPLFLQSEMLQAHSDPLGDVYPNVAVEDGNFAIYFVNNQAKSDDTGSQALRMVCSPEGALLSPRHAHGTRPDLDEELGYPAKTEARVGEEKIVFERAKLGQPGYALEKGGTRQSHRLPWPEDLKSTFEAGCADADAIGIASIRDEMLFLSHFDRHRFTLPQTVQVSEPKALPFIWDFPVVSNLVRANGRYYIAWPRFGTAAGKFECVLSTWKPGEDRPTEIVLDQPADWNSHLSLAAIGNRLCLAYHCLTGEYAPISKIITVFRSTADD